MWSTTVVGDHLIGVVAPEVDAQVALGLHDGERSLCRSAMILFSAVDQIRHILVLVAAGKHVLDVHDSPCQMA